MSEITTDFENRGLPGLVIGFAAEYNPMHLGHLYHLQQIKKIYPDSTVICVMSGSFTQRGEPAVMDKWSRAKVAVENGVDLVVELPVSWAVSSSDRFADGSIFLLNQLNVNKVIFGSESSDLKSLVAIAHILECESEQVGKHIREGLKNGRSYPYLISEYIEKSGKSKEELRFSNDLLGISYIRSMARINSSMTADVVKRQGGDYNQTLKEVKSRDSLISATAIRELIQKIDENYEKIDVISKYIPEFTYRAFIKEIEAGRAPVFKEDMERFLLIRLRGISQEDLVQYPGMKNGIEKLFIKSFRECVSLDKALFSVKNKSITMARLKRVLCWLLLDMKNQCIQACGRYPAYIRPLAYNRQGEKLLATVRNKTDIPILTKVRTWKRLLASFNRKAVERGIFEIDEKRFQHNLELEFRATDIRDSMNPGINSRRGFRDLTTSPFRVETEE